MRRRWTREQIAELVGGGLVYARDEHAALVDLPPWLPTPSGDVPPWDEQISWIHPADRGMVVSAWWNAVANPAQPVSIRFRTSPDGGETWNLSEGRYLNLLQQEDVGSILISHEVLGPIEVVEEPASASFETPTWIIQHLEPIGAVLRTQGHVDEVFGRPAEDLVGHNVLDYLHPDDCDAAIAMWLEVLAAPSATRTIRQRIVRPDGSWVWLESTVMNQLEETGAVVAISHDVSVRHQQEAALRASEQEFRALAEGVPAAVFRADASGAITFANTLWHELCGPITSVFELATDGEAIRGRWQELVGDAEVSWEIDVPAAGDRWLRLRCRSLPPVAGAPVVIGTVDDVTAELALTDELRERAEHDALTGLANRAGFDRLATEALTAGTDVALVFVDLDGFKVVNDTWGHAAGDAVLQEVADRLRSVVRPGDLVARYGGDEFVLLCSQVAPGEDAAIAARIEMALDRAIAVEDGHWRPAASVGVVRPSADEEPQAALRRADDEMYRRKRGRRR